VRDREALGVIGHAQRELVRRRLAEDDRAGRAQPGGDGRVDTLAPVGCQHPAVRCGRRVLGGDDVLDGQRDPLQGARVDAVAERLVRLRGRFQRGLGHDRDERPERLLHALGPFEQGRGEVE